jgi:hypothetical protein
MARSRDYAAEYARRIARGQAHGLSRSQARGHPRVREPLATQVGRPVQPAYTPRLEVGLRHMLRGDSLHDAAAAAHVAPERLRNYFAQSGFARKERGRWVFDRDQIVRRMLLYSDGRARIIQVRGSESASLIGRYMNAVKRFLRTNDATNLDPFRDDIVTDIRRRKHRLETRPNVLYAIDGQGPEPFEQVYRILI